VAGAAAHVALFGAGVASFLAPCVVPLMPAYVGMMAGEAVADGPAGEHAETQVGVPPSAGPLLRAGILFVFGFSTVFVAIGAFAGQLGSSLDSLQLWIQRVGGVLVIVFGLLLLGVARNRLRERRLLSTIPTSGRVVRPVVMGVAFGAAWTPCVGPLLGAALVVAANTADPLAGASLLAAYSLGIGTPFLAAALAVASWPSLLRALRRWSRRIEPVAGAVLIVVGLLLVTGAYTHLLGPVARLMPGAF